LREIWRVLQTRRSTVCATLLVCLAGTVLYNFLATPTYQATATLQIDREEPNLTRLDRDAPLLPEPTDYIETQYRVLQSRSLARRVVDKLGLIRDEEIGEQPGDETSVEKDAEPGNA
jgi:uncharacterized protein involved in exopolysaccharide biosynthesis